jgi:hypothetical protein
MDDVVAVEVQLADGASRYFLTWGRIQDPVDPTPVCDLVLEAAERFAIGGEALQARLCETLKEVAKSDAAPYFYECFLKFAQEKVPFGDDYDAWKQEKAKAMRAGHDIVYCGSPKLAGPSAASI